MHEVLPTKRQAAHKPLICPTGQVRSGSKSVLVGKSGGTKRTSRSRELMSGLRGNADITWKRRHFRFCEQYIEKVISQEERDRPSGSLSIKMK